MSKVQYNQYGCHKHLYQQGTVQPVRMSQAPLSARYSTNITDVKAPVSARYNTTSTDVTSTSISKVQLNQYGCHKHLYQQGTIQPVRMSQAPLSARYNTTSTDVTSTSISNVQYNQYGCHKHLYQQGTTQPVRMSQAPL